MIELYHVNLKIFSKYYLGKLLFTHMKMKTVFTHVTLVGVAHVIADYGLNKSKSQITSISIRPNSACLNSKIKHHHSVF